MIHYFVKLKRLLRYLFTGLVLLALDAGIVLVLIVYFSVNPGVAQFIGRLSGATAGFFLHKYFTFRPVDSDATQLSTVVQVNGYFLVTLFTLFVSPWVFLGLINIALFEVVIAKLMTDLLMVAVTFIALRWLFSVRNTV